jgi:translation elongation factor P/translation initiation factor 5A
METQDITEFKFVQVSSLKVGDFVNVKGKPHRITHITACHGGNKHTEASKIIEAEDVVTNEKIGWKQKLSGLVELAI